jgi:hypothetical protein
VIGLVASAALNLVVLFVPLPEAMVEGIVGLQAIGLWIEVQRANTLPHVGMEPVSDQRGRLRRDSAHYDAGPPTAQDEHLDASGITNVAADKEAMDCARVGRALLSESLAAELWR